VEREAGVIRAGAEEPQFGLRSSVLLTPLFPKVVVRPGADVMQTIFCDFRRKKCVFLKNQCYDQKFA
jgi:hypothetical protein